MGYTLCSLVYNIENFKNNAITRAFTSKQHAQGSINNIELTISKLWEQIKISKKE